MLLLWRHSQKMIWHLLPELFHITQEQKAASGHKPMKERMTILLCANASGDLKVKPLVIYQLENPQAFTKHSVNKASRRLGTQGACLWNGCMRLTENNLSKKCLLEDDVVAHPPSLIDDMDAESNFIMVVFLPTPLLKPASELKLQEAVHLRTIKQVFYCDQGDTEEVLEEPFQHLSLHQPH